MSKVLLLNGSAHQHGCTATALDEMIIVFEAEGVETEKQMKFIKDNGCDYIQGYYFSKPLPPEEFEKLIEKEISIKR